jgi:hypothetical protein
MWRVTQIGLIGIIVTRRQNGLSCIEKLRFISKTIRSYKNHFEMTHTVCIFLYAKHLSVSYHAYSQFGGNYSGWECLL